MDARTARLVDVNLNRLTEGLKVVEDVVRFALDRPGLLRSIRALRARAGAGSRGLRRRVVRSRDSGRDAGRADRFDRTQRRNLEDVLMANFKRAEESARVLEEVLKIEDARLAARFKAVRFRLYDLEKKPMHVMARRVKP